MTFDSFGGAKHNLTIALAFTLALVFSAPIKPPTKPTALFAKVKAGVKGIAGVLLEAARTERGAWINRLRLWVSTVFATELLSWLSACRLLVQSEGANSTRKALYERRCLRRIFLAAGSYSVSLVASLYLIPPFTQLNFLIVALIEPA